MMTKDLRGQSFVSRGNVYIRPTDKVRKNGGAFRHIKSLLITCLYNLCDPVSCEERDCM